MSGISAVATFLGNQTQSWAGSTLNRMLAALSPCGCDQIDRWDGEQVALGRTLLRLVPEDAFDQQPLRGTHTSFYLVADARLDNRGELARELGLSQPELYADTSLLAAAWERWGIACLDHLLGAFAFAVWDPRSRELFAARDHAGEYPLFFHRGADFVAIASMPKALQAIPEVPRGFDEQRIADWLVYAYPERGTTFFEGIERLPPGHWLRASAAGVEVREYWHPSRTKPTRFRKDSEYAEALSDLVDRATLPRLRTIGGVATQLSAGLDSGSVTASAASMLAREGKGLTAYTSVPQPDFVDDNSAGRMLVDEGPGAAEVAALYPNIHHVKITTESSDLVAMIHRVTAELDEPIMNAANWLWYLAMLEHAREHNIGTILQGAFGNYTISYDTMQPLAEMFRHGNWHRLARTVLQLRANGETSFKASARIALAGLYPPVLDFKTYREKQAFNLDFLAINRDFAHRYRLREKARERLFPPLFDRDEQRKSFEQFDFAPLAAAARALTRVDLRDPTGDKRIWEFCYSIPLEQYIAGGQARSLIRRAMQGRLPPSTLTRTRRGLQGADWYLTMQRALPAMRQQLHWIAESPAARRILDLERLEQRMNTLPTSGFQRTTTYETWHVGLLRGLSVGMFLRSHDQEASAL